MAKLALEPYLVFNGACDEAIELYQQALGAQLLVRMSFDQSPEPAPPGVVPPGFEKKVMHAAMQVGGGRIMLSDGCSAEPAHFQGFNLSVAGSDEADARRIFEALAAEGGTVTMPLGRTFWSPLFGMVTDRFGVSWMIGVEPST